MDPGVRYWNYPNREYNNAPSPGQTPQFQRWCSSYLSEPGQLYNKKTGRGYDGQIYFGNEESGDEGRSFGVTTEGQAQQLPRLGLFSWENTLVGLNEGDVTYSHGQEDTASGQLWVYIGRKLKGGTAFDKAGLTNGQDFVLDLENEAVDSDAEFRATYGKNKPTAFTLGPEEEVDWDQNGAAQNAQGRRGGSPSTASRTAHLTRVTRRTSTSSRPRAARALRRTRPAPARPVVTAAASGA